MPQSTDPGGRRFRRMQEATARKEAFRHPAPTRHFRAGRYRHFFSSLSCFSTTIVDNLWIPMRKIDNDEYRKKGRPVPSWLFLRSRTACLIIKHRARPVRRAPNRVQEDRDRGGNEGGGAKYRKKARDPGQDPGNAGFQDVGPEVCPVPEKHLRVGMRRTIRS